MPGDPVNEQARTSWTDEQLVGHVREWSIERSKCGLNYHKFNRICDRELFPCYAVLAERGPRSLRKLLPLTADENPEVQLVAASFAFEADPPRCRQVLERLMRKSGGGVLALVTLLDKDPEFADEYGDLAALGHQRCEEEMTRRYGGRW